MLLFLSTYILTIPFLFILFGLGVIFEAADSNASVFVGIISAIIAFFVFDVPLLTIVLSTIGYFVIGVLWSVWRYKRYADTKVQKYIESKSDSSYDRKEIVNGLKLNYMVGRITSWIIIWPFSMVENVTGDILRLIKNIVTEQLKSVYNKIYTNATSKLPFIQETETK